MIRTAPLLGLALALLVTGVPSGREAAAQTAGPRNPHAGLAGAPADPHAGLAGAPKVQDVPSGPATIRGRVVHRTRGSGAAGVPVTLFALGRDGRAGVRRLETEPDGSFRFGGVSNDPGTVYLIGVRYAGVPFGMRTTFASGELSRQVTLEIADASAAASGLAIGAARLRIARGCSGVRITETHELRNPSDVVYYVPEAERATVEPIFSIPLPASAAALQLEAGGLEGGLEQREDDVVFWGPLHPGSASVEFSYSLAVAGDAVALDRVFPRGAEKAVVMTWADGPAAQGPGLEPGDPESVDGVPYATVASGPLAPGEGVAFSLDLAAAPAGGASPDVSEAKIWLELDDAALDVREELAFFVDGEEPLQSRSDAPLVCLPLPAGAEGLRFSQAAFAMGIQPDSSGVLGLRGPIPPGESEIAMSYLIRSGDRRVEFSHPFPLGASLLSLLIADTGLRMETDRLHRRRPISTPDRTYIHLEAFEIEPGETVTLGLESLPAPRPLPRLASVGFVVAAAALVVAFLTGALRAPDAAEAPTAADPSAADAERDSVYAAIRDLEEDFETGKVSAEDHAAMLAELRARAAELLRAERVRAATAAAAAAAVAASEPAAASAAVCPSCGAATGANARFCSQCGASLEKPEAAGDSSV